jgi:hypothetical protein
MTPQKIRRQETRKRTKKRCMVATRFVNTFKLEDFTNTFTLRPGQNEQFLRDLGIALREAWDEKKWDTAAENLEQIFADQKGAILSAMKPGIYPGLPSPFERPAFRIRIGHADPVFEPRDALDKIAHTILQASHHGLLKMCEGHRRGWDCPTPFLVADEERRKFCFNGCGDKAKAEAKRNPKKGRKN